MTDYSFRPIFLHCRSLYYHVAPQQPKQARFTAAWMGFFFWRVDLRPKFTMQSLHNQFWTQTYSPKKKNPIHAAAIWIAGGDSLATPDPYQWAHFLNEWDVPLPRTQRSHTIKQPCYNNLNGRSGTSRRAQYSSSQASLTSLAKSLEA